MLFQDPVIQSVNHWIPVTLCWFNCSVLQGRWWGLPTLLCKREQVVVIDGGFYSFSQPHKAVAESVTKSKLYQSIFLLVLKGKANLYWVLRKVHHSCLLKTGCFRSVTLQVCGNACNRQWPWQTRNLGHVYLERGVTLGLLLQCLTGVPCSSRPLAEFGKS